MQQLVKLTRTGERGNIYINPWQIVAAEPVTVKGQLATVIHANHPTIQKIFVIETPAQINLAIKEASK